MTRTFKIYSLSNFQVHSSVLLAIDIMLPYIRSPEPIHLLSDHHHSFLPISLATTVLLTVPEFAFFFFLDSTYKCDLNSISLSLTDLFHIAWCPQKMMLWKCCTQYASKSGKFSNGHRTGKGPFSFQSQRKEMPKNVQTTAQLQSSHMLAK